MPETAEDKTEIVRERAGRKGSGRVVLEWGGKSLLVIIPALATGYFSMRESKFAADIEIARINAKAGAGYEALAEVLKEESSQRKALADESKRLAAYVEKLELRLDALAQSHVNHALDPDEETNARARSRRAGGSRAGTVAVPNADIILGRGAASTAVEPKKLFQEQRPTKAPPKSLEDAARLRGL